MKKTLIALLALSGVASGATTFTGDFACDNSEYTVTFDSTDLSVTHVSCDKAKKNINTIDSTTGQTNTEPDGETLTNATTFTPDVNIGNDPANSWTLNLTLSNNTNEVMDLSAISFDVFLFNGNGNAQSADTYARPISLTLMDGSTQIGKIDSLAMAGNNWMDVADFALTDCSIAAGETKEISLTVKSAQTATSYGTYVGLNGLQVVTASVPEPATASLSLLGLAALMIRRRRA